MNKTCVLVLKMADQIVDESDADYVGVDSGALLLLEKGIPMHVAMGDFDSVSESDRSRIREHCERFIPLNPIKDDSDSEAAIRAMDQAGYETLIVCGGLGGRIDHEIVNLKLCEAYPNRMRLVNSKNQIQCLTTGIYSFTKESFSYWSVFAIEESCISLEGFKYPLEDRILKPSDIYGLSNEILEAKGTLTVHSGKVMIIQTND